MAVKDVDPKGRFSERGQLAIASFYSVEFQLLFYGIGDPTRAPFNRSSPTHFFVRRFLSPPRVDRYKLRSLPESGLEIQTRGVAWEGDSHTTWPSRIVDLSSERDEYELRKSMRGLTFRG